MKDRFFLDTNIFVYSFDPDSPGKARVAAEWIHRGLTAGSAVISYQVVQEFFNVVLRKFAQPITIGDAEQYLFAVFRPLPQVQPSQELFLEALRIKDRFLLGWYDSLVVAAALKAGCDRLLTEDLQHGQRFGSLRVENPFLPS